MYFCDLIGWALLWTTFLYGQKKVKLSKFSFLLPGTFPACHNVQDPAHRLNYQFPRCWYIKATISGIGQKQATVPAHHFANDFHTFVTSAGQQDNINIILLIFSLPMSSRVMVSIPVVASPSFDIFVNSASLQKEKHQLKIIAVLGFLSFSAKFLKYQSHCR